MYKTLTFLAFIFVFISCQNNKEAAMQYDKTVLVNYYLRSDNTDFVTAEVYVRHESDTSLPNIESVTLEGNALLKSAYQNNSMWRFRLDQDIKANNYEFVVNQTGQQPIKTKLSTKPIRRYTIKEGVISKSKGFTVTWDGDAVNESNETFVLLITDTNGQSMSLNRVGGTAESGMFIDPVQLDFFAPGKANFYLIRKNLIDFPQEGHVKQSAEIEFYSDEITIDIVE
jgi:hypothetical protein